MSNAKNTHTPVSGVGFLGLLTIAFIVLKLCGVIDWSWWWVLAPLWLPAAVVLGIALLFTLFCLGMAGVAWLLK